MFYIDHWKTGKSLVEYRSYQKSLIDRFNKYDRNIILSCRQSGLSSLLNNYSSNNTVRFSAIRLPNQEHIYSPNGFKIPLNIENIKSILTKSLSDIDTIILDNASWAREEDLKSFMDRIEHFEGKVIIASTGGSNSQLFNHMFKNPDDYGYKRSAIRAFLLPYFSKDWKNNRISLLDHDTYKKEYELRS